MRILLRAGKAPHDAVGPEASFARNRSGVFGANVGNLLFTNAVYQALNTPSADVTVDSLETESPRVNERYVHRINDEFDTFVLPLANAFRPQFQPWLDRLSGVIEKLTIPVVVVGVGAQLGSNGDYSRVSPETNASVSRFMRAVLDRSSSVGVRGEITADYLRSLGFDGSQVDVIGCPSMYVNGRSQRIDKRDHALAPDARLGVNITPTIQGMGKKLTMITEEYPNAVYIPQEHRELALLLWGQPVAGKLDPGMPKDISHPLYQQDRIRFFLDPSTWREYLSETDFALGNRIHGNIAALTAGTPAMLLSHDSRTLELARYHGIPFQQAPSADEDIHVGELFESADFTEFNDVGPENFDRYVRFLEANALSHIYQAEHANPGYEDKLAATSFPEPVGSLFAKDRDALISRVRWLWQSVEVDQTRKVGSYTPPFRPDSPPSEIASLKSELKKLRALVESHEGTIEHVRQPFEQRLVQSLKTRAKRVLRRRP